jgi:hypothetical protein
MYKRALKGNDEKQGLKHPDTLSSAHLRSQLNIIATLMGLKRLDDKEKNVSLA